MCLSMWGSYIRVYPKRKSFKYVSAKHEHMQHETSYDFLCFAGQPVGLIGAVMCAELQLGEALVCSVRGDKWNISANIFTFQILCWVRNTFHNIKKIMFRGGSHATQVQTWTFLRFRIHYCHNMYPSISRYKESTGTLSSLMTTHHQHHRGINLCECILSVDRLCNMLSDRRFIFNYGSLWNSVSRTVYMNTITFP